MNIPDNVIKQKLQNIYFIWGSGKTTTANALAEKHKFYVYHTDDNRSRHCKNANPDFQPALCRNVLDIWALEKDDALQWEIDIVREMTPMIIADLIQLSTQYKGVICEGDIDIDFIMPVVTNAVTISNHGKNYDFFDRPEQKHMLDDIKNRTGITEAEKQKIIDKAYAIISGDGIDNKFELPRETKLYGVKQIIRNESTSVDDVLRMIEEYWGLGLL